VEVKTRPGHGSTFTVYLPAAPQDVVPVELAPRQQVPRGNGETVMIVDDEVGILQLTQSTLEAHGYKVVAARDGVQGLARFAENADTVGVVLTDIMMPQMDGVGLVRALRKVNPNVPIIASTGLLNAHGDGDRAATLRELGVQQFLYKPFQNEELLRALHRALHPGLAES
jgi:CheY-like chemotaxis protein